MNSEEIQDDTLIVADKNWNALTEKAKTIGYREGVIDGKESVFQENFDKGYEAGYNCGYSLGVYKGTIEAKKLLCKLNDDQKKVLDDLEQNAEVSECLKKPQNGLCQICLDDSLLSKSVNELITEQSKYSKEKLLKLEEKFNR